MGVPCAKGLLSHSPSSQLHHYPVFPTKEQFTAASCHQSSSVLQLLCRHPELINLLGICECFLEEAVTCLLKFLFIVVVSRLW